MDILDQGSIIFGLRFSKYAEVPCYGVVITASCDLHNNKVNKVYYICSLKIDEWIFTNSGFELLTKPAKKDCYNKIKSIANSYKLNDELLANFSNENFIEVIEAHVNKETDKKTILKYYEDYTLFSSATKKQEKIKLIQNYKKIITNKLEEIIKDKHSHLYFLPPKATTINNDSDLGYILDFQEIDSVTLEQAKKIVSGEIDGLLYSEEDLSKLNSKFWLNSKNDFALIYGNVLSPQREHLMQKFSGFFTRIGLEDSENDNAEKIIKLLLGEGK